MTRKVRTWEELKALQARRTAINAEQTRQRAARKRAERAAIERVRHEQAMAVHQPPKQD